MRKYLDQISEKLRDDLMKSYKDFNIYYIFYIYKEYVIEF